MLLAYHCLLTCLLLTVEAEGYAACILLTNLLRTVEVEHVEGEDADLHLEVVHVGVLALARREHLEGSEG